MPIELTIEQTKQLTEERELPAGVRDPHSEARYVLVPVEQYERMIEIIEDDAEQRSLRRAAAKGLANRLEAEGE